MFATLKQIFNPKNKDLQKRILFTFFALFVFKLGTAIVVPGIDKEALGLANLGILELANVMGGGALGNFSIFALGVMPYITASIVIQLLQMDIIPYLAELNKQGGVGRNKLNQITRIAGIVLAFIQGYFYSFTYIKGNSVMDYMQFSLILTAGTCLLLWLGDQITAKGLGNGISLIIMAGIIASLPSMFTTAFTNLVSTDTSQSLVLGIASFAIFVIIYILIIIGVVFEQLSERRVPIQYANRSNSSYGGRQNYIPFKLNSAGVVPVIFASTLLSIPAIISTFINKNGKYEQFALFVDKWLTMTNGTGFVLYILLIFGFAYFYTFLQIKPKEMAENLQQNGGYIPGVRPGDETTKYIVRILKRITIVGASSLVILASLPIIFGWFSKLPTSVTIGGTGLLIVVGVALETYKQLESTIVSRNYKGRK